MAKPIILNQSLIDNMVNEFRKHLLDAKMSDGKVTYTKNFEYTGENNVGVSVMFTPVAYLKMLSLLRHFDSEVAWHGAVERRSDNMFVITDIIVYPQEVTGATVNTDQEEYQKWLMELDDDFFNSMRMQGHSHVNFATNPSATDLTHQESILRQLNGNSYYIFMIFNKRLEHNIKVYDYSTNTLYEDKDVEVGIVGDGFDLDAFIEESDGVVKKKYSGIGTYGYPGSSYTTPHAAASAVTKTETKPKTAKTSNKDNKETKKKGRPPKASKDSSAGQMSFSGYPGVYGADEDVDYDQMIFGNRRT